MRKKPILTAENQPLPQPLSKSLSKPISKTPVDTTSTESGSHAVPQPLEISTPRVIDITPARVRVPGMSQEQVATEPPALAEPSETPSTSKKGFKLQQQPDGLVRLQPLDTKKHLHQPVQSWRLPESPSATTPVTSTPPISFWDKLWHSPSLMAAMTLFGALTLLFVIGAGVAILMRTLQRQKTWIYSPNAPSSLDPNTLGSDAQTKTAAGRPLPCKAPCNPHGHARKPKPYL